MLAVDPYLVKSIGNWLIVIGIAIVVIGVAVGLMKRRRGG